jgi:hypothetical protein
MMRERPSTLSELRSNIISASLMLGVVLLGAWIIVMVTS